MSEENSKWALILGASSGFGLATAKRLAADGMNLFLVHRDRRGAMRTIQPAFDELSKSGVKVITCNADALGTESRDELINQLADALGDSGKVHLMLHSIALGNLKLVASEVSRPQDSNGDKAIASLAEALGIDADALATQANRLFDEGHDALLSLAKPAEYSSTAFLNEGDFSQTIHAMGTSLVGWTCGVLERDLFATDARVIGLTSEGNAVAWKGYAAVGAAKCALESVARSLAVELGPRGLRVNVLQPGVTDTAALRAIPGHRHLLTQAASRNPGGRLTTPEDVAGVVYLLSRPESQWINGCVIRVDGGEHISGLVA